MTQYTEHEGALRVDLAACCRLVALNGWDDLRATPCPGLPEASDRVNIARLRASQPLPGPIA